MCSEVFVPHLLTVFRQYSDGRIVLDKSRWSDQIPKVHTVRSQKWGVQSRATLWAQPGTPFRCLLECFADGVVLLGFSNTKFVMVGGLRRDENTLLSEHRSSAQRVVRDSVFWICWTWEGPIFPLVELSEHDRSVDPSKLSVFTLISGCTFQVYQLHGSESA